MRTSTIVVAAALLLSLGCGGTNGQDGTPGATGATGAAGKDGAPGKDAPVLYAGPVGTWRGMWYRNYTTGPDGCQYELTISGPDTDLVATYTETSCILSTPWPVPEQLAGTLVGGHGLDLTGPNMALHGIQDGDLITGVVLFPAWAPILLDTFAFRKP